MSENGKLLRMPPLDDDAIEEGMRRLREKMMRDAEQVWNELVAQARFGYDEAVKFQAQKLALAYTLGMPTERVEVTQRTMGKRTAPALEDLSAEELRAVAILREGQRRRAIESGEDEE
jgi:hypothetical protein